MCFDDKVHREADHFDLGGCFNKHQQFTYHHLRICKQIEARDRELNSVQDAVGDNMSQSEEDKLTWLDFISNARTAYRTEPLPAHNELHGRENVN